MSHMETILDDLQCIGKRDLYQCYGCGSIYIIVRGNLAIVFSNLKDILSVII
jgi:hypothetical protein